MEVTHEISIDLLKPRRNLIHVVQEDSTRKIRLTLLKDNLPYNVDADLASGESLLSFVEFLKSDGHGGMYDTTSLGENAVALEDPLGAHNVWIVALDGQCFTAPGFAQINVRFETEAGRRIHTFPIIVDVEATASSDTESTDWGELNSIADLRNAVGAMWDKMFPPEAKQKLLTLLSKVAYTDEHGQEYLDELEEAMFQTADIVSISAVFDQGSATIYDTDDLDTLKQYLTVTATYEDLSTREVTGYTLSGTLTEGTSTITVSYGDKTTTFNVTVTQFPYAFVEYIENPGDANSWIELNIVPSNTFGFKAELAFAQRTSDVFVFGTREITDGRLLMGAGSNKKPYFGWANASSNTNLYSAIEWNTPFTAKLNYKNDRKPMLNDANTFGSEIPALGFTPTWNFVVLGFRSTNGTTGRQCRIYAFEITEGENVVMNLKPCYRRSDNAIGLFDAVNSVFYGNSGTGSLAKGADL